MYWKWYVEGHLGGFQGEFQARRNGRILQSDGGLCLHEQCYAETGLLWICAKVEDWKLSIQVDFISFLKNEL